MADKGLLLAIDTTSDLAGVALMQGSDLIGEVTWYAHQSHSRQLLPALDWLLRHVGHGKHEIEAIAVCLGPGSYAGMRVGISTAKALAYGLGAVLVGVGRLAAEALPVAEATDARVLAFQAAGRAELAWGLYRHDGRDFIEVEAPHLSPTAGLLKSLRKGDAVTGDILRLDSDTRTSMVNEGCRLVPSVPSRVVAVARLGRLRLDRDETDDADTLVPLYLRAPAIGPQTPL